MTYPHVAIAFTVLGIAIWALALCLGPVPDFLDLRTRHLARILAGAICFALAAILMLIEALTT